jgi:site-specific recombinase XerD
MFYAEVVGQEEKVLNIIRPKRSRKLPQVLMEEEVIRLVAAISTQRKRIRNPPQALLFLIQEKLIFV